MARTHSSIAIDSAAELEELVGNDATATIENDPKFVDTVGTETASSDNVEVQRDTDDTEDSEEELDDEDEDDEDSEDDEIDDDEIDEEVDDEDEVGVADATVLA